MGMLNTYKEVNDEIRSKIRIIEPRHEILKILDTDQSRNTVYWLFDRKSFTART